MIPSGIPTTSVPSAVPSLAGWVATVSASTVTTEQIDQAVIDDYALTLAEYYAVETSDVAVSTVYETSGSLTMTIPEGVTENEVVDAVTASIAESLGVHAQDVEVTVDMETGDVGFAVTSDTYSDAANTQFDLDNSNYQDAIVNSIATLIPSATVDSYEVSDEISANIEFTVDADDASNDLTQASWQTEQLLSDAGWTVEVESNQSWDFDE